MAQRTERANRRYSPDIRDFGIQRFVVTELRGRNFMCSRSIALNVVLDCVVV